MLKEKELRRGNERDEEVKQHEINKICKKRSKVYYYSQSSGGGMLGFHSKPHQFAV